MQRYTYTISCTGCGAIQSHDRKQTDAPLTGDQMVAEVVHSGDCPLEQSGNHTINIDISNATNTLYSIS